MPLYFSASYKSWRKNMKSALMFLMLSLVLSVNAYAGDLAKDLDKATKIIEDFVEIPEQSIPVEVLNDAQGLAIITVVKAGFIISGRVGTGIIIAKTPEGWSAPSAIGTGGGGFGLQIGGQVTDFVIVLNTPEAVEAFSQGGNVTLGGGVSVAAGPVGRTAEAGVAPTAAVYTYSRSKGLFAGVSLEGTVIVEKKKTNEAFYGRPIRASEIITKAVPSEHATALYNALSAYGVSGTLTETVEVVE